MLSIERHKQGISALFCYVFRSNDGNRTVSSCEYHSSNQEKKCKLPCTHTARGLYLSLAVLGGAYLSISSPHSCDDCMVSWQTAILTEVATAAEAITLVN